MISELKAIAEKIISDNPKVLKIILFGSLIHGLHAPGSDADIIIELNDDRRRFMDRIPQFLKYFLQAPLAVDVFPLTKKELMIMQQQKTSFYQQAVESGMVICQK